MIDEVMCPNGRGPPEPRDGEIRIDLQVPCEKVGAVIGTKGVIIVALQVGNSMI
jgi:hypothetical protein